MNKIIEIGKTQTEVRINHMRMSFTYFSENILKTKLTPVQKGIIKRIQKMNNNTFNKDEE